MATIPARTKVYSTRSNIPIYDNSSAAGVSKSNWWNLKACLLNQTTSGSLTGVRDSSSVWTVKHSCDGVTAGTPGDGVDRWGTSFDATKIVQATYSANHSWFVMTNTALGVDILLSTNSATPSQGRIAFSQNGFGSGAINLDPSGSDQVNFGATSATNASVTTIWGDTATGNNDRHADAPSGGGPVTGATGGAA